MSVTSNRNRSFAPYVHADDFSSHVDKSRALGRSSAGSTQSSFLDLLGDTPEPDALGAYSSTRHARAAGSKKPTPNRRGPKAANGPETSLLDLLFDEPEMPTAKQLNGAAANDSAVTPYSAGIGSPYGQSAQASQQTVSLMDQVDRLEQQLCNTQAQFNANATLGSNLLVANQNIDGFHDDEPELAALSPLRHVERSLFHPQYWLYLGCFAGAALAFLFGLVFFPLDPSQGFDTLVVRALFGAFLGLLWAVLPFLMHQKQMRSSIAALEARDVYSTWQTRGQIIAE